MTRIEDRAPGADFSLSDRVIIITGGAGLLGVKYAEAVAAAGGIPVIADIREEAALAQAKSLESAWSVATMGIRLDVTQADSVEAVRHAVVDRFGRIDALVNNAANNPKVEAPDEAAFSRLETFSREKWEADLAVGLTGAFLCSQIIGGALAKQGHGVIVNISSEYGLIAPDQRLYHRDDLPPELQPVKPVSYTVLKAGLHGLTKYLATYWADAGVRVNTITVGGVYNGQPDEFVQRACFRVPMGRMARPTEIQGALVFLCSDASSFVTGSNIVVDGGKCIW